MKTFIDYRELDAYEAPKDGFKYQWVAKRNIGKPGWQETEVCCGDLTLCKMNYNDWKAIAVKDEINKIQRTLNQVARTSIPMGGSDCDKFEIFIKDELFDEVFKQFKFPEYVRVKRVMQ